jgi:hypothetical protein
MRLSGSVQEHLQSSKQYNSVTLKQGRSVSFLAMYSRRQSSMKICTQNVGTSSTYDHRTLRTRLPVRSAIYKQCTGGLVVEFVRIGESPLLYVFANFC